MPAKQIGVIRAKKDGSGCSLCRASEENVGKRRCNHILDNANMQIVMSEKGINYIDISGQVNKKRTELSIKADEEKVKGFISNLAKGLSKKDQESILSVLRED
jgi:hypothetical protein